MNQSSEDSIQQLMTQNEEHFDYYVNDDEDVEKYLTNLKNGHSSKAQENEIDDDKTKSSKHRPKDKKKKRKKKKKKEKKKSESVNIVDDDDDLSLGSYESTSVTSLMSMSILSSSNNRAIKHSAIEDSNIENKSDYLEEGSQKEETIGERFQKMKQTNRAISVEDIDDDFDSVMYQEQEKLFQSPEKKKANTYSVPEFPSPAVVSLSPHSEQDPSPTSTTPSAYSIPSSSETVSIPSSTPENSPCANNSNSISSTVDFTEFNFLVNNNSDDDDNCSVKQENDISASKPATKISKREKPWHTENTPVRNRESPPSPPNFSQSTINDYDAKNNIVEEKEGEEELFFMKHISDEVEKTEEVDHTVKSSTQAPTWMSLTPDSPPQKTLTNTRNGLSDHNQENVGVDPFMVPPPSPSPDDSDVPSKKSFVSSTSSPERTPQFEEARQRAMKVLGICEEQNGNTTIVKIEKKKNAVLPNLDIRNKLKRMTSTPLFGGGTEDDLEFDLQKRTDQMSRFTIDDNEEDHQTNGRRGDVDRSNDELSSSTGTNAISRVLGGYAKKLTTPRERDSEEELEENIWSVRYKMEDKIYFATTPPTNNASRKKTKINFFGRKTQDNAASWSDIKLSPMMNNQKEYRHYWDGSSSTSDNNRNSTSPDAVNSIGDFYRNEGHDLDKKRAVRKKRILVSIVACMAVIGCLAGVYFTNPTGVDSFWRSSSSENNDDELGFISSILDDQYYSGSEVDNDAIIFYVLSDVPQTKLEEDLLSEYISYLPNDADFAIHLGNIHDPSQSNCQEDVYENIASIFSLSPVPLLAIPSQSDWQGCPIPENEALDLWRSHFGTLAGSNDIYLERQSGRVENFSFVMKENVLFLGINIVGKYAHHDDTDKYQEDLDEDNISWTIQNINKFISSSSGNGRAIVIFGHARAGTSQYAFYFKKIQEYIDSIPPTKSFIKEIPILYVHGDILKGRPNQIDTLNFPYKKEDFHNLRSVLVEPGGKTSPLKIAINHQRKSESLFVVDRQAYEYD